MKVNPDPTEEGLLRYRATNGFFNLADFFVVRKKATRLVPCRCRSYCVEPCSGSCGCQACAWRAAADGQPTKRGRLQR